MGIWDHIILEGFCTFSWASKKEWKMYSYDNTKKLLTDKSKPIIRKNEDYISPMCRPNWCIKHNKRFAPQFKCLCYSKDGKRCPFFAYTEATKKDKNIMLKAWFEKNKRV